MTSTEWNFQSDINQVKSTYKIRKCDINKITFTVDINRVKSPEWHQQRDIHRCTVWPRLLLPPDSVRYDFIPFTCRQLVPTSMIRNGRTTMTAALSKTERSILHGQEQLNLSWELSCELKHVLFLVCWCCTLRSGLHDYPTMIRTFPHGLEKSHACKWISDNFPRMLTYVLFLENFIKSICMHGCL